MSDRYRPRGPRNQQRGGYQSRSSYIPQRRDNRNRDSYIPSGPKRLAERDNYRPDNDRYQQQENRPASSIPHGESPLSLSGGTALHPPPKGQEILMHLE